MTEIEKLINSINTLNSNIEKLITFQLSPASSVSAPVEKILYCDWLNEFMYRYKKDMQSDSTFKDNLSRIKNYILPSLGNIFIDEFTGEEIQETLLSIDLLNTRQKVAIIINESFVKAVALDKIDKNPFRTVSIKKHVSKHYNVIQPKTQKLILKNIADIEYQKIFKFFCCTGFRISEGCSIDNENIDRKSHRIFLDMEDTTTKKHKRYIDYLPELLDGFSIKGKIITKSENAIKQYFYKLFKKLSIKLNRHSFRHTFISCCNAVGFDAKQIQLYAGHRDISMTFNTYTHIIDCGNSPILDYLNRLKKTVEQRKKRY